MQLSKEITKKIIKHLIKSEDYRDEIFSLLDANFFDYINSFIIECAKHKKENSQCDWYLENFILNNSNSDNICIYAGLNKKSIFNKIGSATKEIILNESVSHYKYLSSLLDSPNDSIFNMRVSFEGEDIVFTERETLLILNSLAVKRAAISGGLWSTAGKKAEKPLMEILCKLYGVPTNHYDKRYPNKKNIKNGDYEREIDFYLISSKKQEFRCEVKLMGKGNPESADAIFARQSKVFVADTLSDTNKAQCDDLGVYWIELRQVDGYKKFKHVLEMLDVPHTEFNGNLDDVIDILIDECVL